MIHGYVFCLIRRNCMKGIKKAHIFLSLNGMVSTFKTHMVSSACSSTYWTMSAMRTIMAR